MAQLNTPVGVAALPDGGFLVAEYEGHRVRHVSAAGVITRVAGTGSAGFSGDGGAATAARLNKPVGVSTTSDGGFLIGDSLNGRVRKVSANGTIATVAGIGRARLRGRRRAGAAGTASLPLRRRRERERRDPHRGQRRQPAAPCRRPPRPPKGRLHRLQLPNPLRAAADVVLATAGSVYLPVVCPPTAMQACRGTIRLVRAARCPAAGRSGRCGQGRVRAGPVLRGPGQQQES